MLAMARARDPGFQGLDPSSSAFPGQKQRDGSEVEQLVPELVPICNAGRGLSYYATMLTPAKYFCVLRFGSILETHKAHHKIDVSEARPVRAPKPSCEISLCLKPLSSVVSWQ